MNLDSGSRSTTLHEIDTLEEFLNKKIEKGIKEYEMLAKKRDLLYIRDSLYIFFQIKTGFRIHELLSLTWNKIYDFENDKILEVVHIDKENMKGKHSSRKMYIPSSLHDKILLLKKYWNALFEKELNEDDYVFSSFKARGKKITAEMIFYRLRKIFNESGVNFKIENKKANLSSHSFRKAFINKVYLLTGKDIVKTSKYTGHKDVNSLLHYVEGKDAVVEENLKL